MSRCYFCAVKFEDKETRVAVGVNKEVHTDCYMPYRAYLKQIADALTQDAKKREFRPPP